VPPEQVRSQRFRYSAAITIAAVVAFFGTVPLATSRAYLLPLMLVPVIIGLWSWRAGTDVSVAGLRVRALVGSRLVPWSQVDALVSADRRRAYAILTTGRRVRLPAVGVAELARITSPTPDTENRPDTEGNDGTDATGATDSEQSAQVQ
jgi:hypothetical protein